MMDTRITFSRREGLRAGVPWLIAGGITQFAGGARAQAAPGGQEKAPLESAADRDLRLKWQGEDIALLEAIRALRLSAAQIKRLLPLAVAAEDLLVKSRVADEATLASLEGIQQKQRETLVKGEAASAQDQTYALALMSRLQTRREQAEQEVVRYVLPRLLPLLSGDQVLWAELLIHGITRPGEAASPALMDPRAGFVHPDEPKSQWLTTRLNLSEAEGHFAAARESYSEEVQSDPAAAEAKVADMQKNLQQARAAVAQVPAMTETELNMALEPLVRRMFLSPRLKPVLQERMHNTKG